MAYRPDQPRAPKGSTEGGQWTKGAHGYYTSPDSIMRFRTKKETVAYERQRKRELKTFGISMKSLQAGPEED